MTTQAHAESFEDFKEYVLGEIKTLKEENLKQDQEITALKRGREELISVIQNNVQDIQTNVQDIKTNVQDIVYLKYFSTLMNVPQTCQELGSRGVDRSGSFPINPEGSGMYLTFFYNYHYEVPNNPVSPNKGEGWK